MRKNRGWNVINGGVLINEERKGRRERRKEGKRREAERCKKDKTE